MPTPQGGLSTSAISLMTAVENGESQLVICSLSLIEIWAAMEQTEESLARLRSFYKFLSELPNVRIVGLDSSLLKKYDSIQDTATIQEHDRIIYAAGLEYECDFLISTDQSIKRYNSHGYDSIKVVG